MARKKKSSKPRGLSVFANSPTVVRLFGPLLIILMVAAAGYGIYSLTSEQFGSAANKAKYGPWYYNSRGIKHQFGKVTSEKAWKIGNGKVWYSPIDSLAKNQGKYLWSGPAHTGAKLDPNSQYLGCYFYRLINAGGSSNNNYAKGKVTFQIWNYNNGWKEKRKYIDTGVNVKGISNKSGYDLSKIKYKRLCLAFYLGAGSHDIHLNAKVQGGYMLMKRTKVTKVTKKSNQQPNLKILKKKKDNISWLIGSRFN